jgi:hypothetical protein
MVKKKNLIYQYWLGKPGEAVKYGVENMKNYADRIGAEYIFKTDPYWAQMYCDIPTYYNAFEPIWAERFEEYDNILFADTDVFSVDCLKESIFDQKIGDIGICREEHKEITRGRGEGIFNNKTDKLWNSYLKTKYKVDMPLNDNGDMKIFNTGVVMYSPEGREKARKGFVPFQEYIDYMRGTSLPRFYQIDQNYLHAMMFIADMDITEMDHGWNTYIHYAGNSDVTPRPVYDGRDDREAKLCHVQLRNADNHNGPWHYTIVNKPQSEWDLP